MGCYEVCERVSLGGVGHVELSEGFFGLTSLIGLHIASGFRYIVRQ